MYFIFEEDDEPILYGDVHFVFKHRGVMYDSAFCRISFNTSFTSYPQNALIVNKHSISPDSVSKDARFLDEFMVQFIFEDYCYTCNKPSQLTIDDLCESCRKLMGEDIVYWKTMKIILD